MVIKIHFGKNHHLGYVYKDGEAALKEFQSQFGVEEFEWIDMAVGKVARFMIGNLQIDLMEPRELGSLFNKFLENGNFGLHHIAYLVDNIDEKIKTPQITRIKAMNQHLLSYRQNYFTGPYYG